MRNSLTDSQMLKLRELIGIVPFNELHLHLYGNRHKKVVYFTQQEIFRCILLNSAYFTKEFTGVSLGHKNDAYFTEDEMLNKPIYDYESLSNDEKIIYNLK